MLLSRQGMKVSCYASAAMFLSQAKLADCGCLVLDQNMPGLSGLVLLEELRARGHSLPVIMVTGESDPTLMRRAERAGAMVLLHKPFANGELIDWIERALVADTASNEAHT